MWNTRSSECRRPSQEAEALLQTQAAGLGSEAVETLNLRNELLFHRRL